MAQPSRPTASRVSSQNSSRLDLTDDSQLQQAGRSSSNLHAHRSAQSLRSPSQAEGAEGRSTGDANFSRPNVLRKKSRPNSTVIDTNVDPIPELSLSPTAERTSPASPDSTHKSSLLEKTRSQSSNESQIPADQVRSRKGSNDTIGSLSESSSAGARRLVSASTAGGVNNVAAPLSTGQRTPLPHYGRDALNSRRTSFGSNDGTSTPRSVRDLGVDYSRYYNPFASRNTSQHDLNTPLPRYNSTTQLLPPNGVSGRDLANRLSNPFRDAKRERNPFESGLNTAFNTAPGTPLRQQMSSEAISSNEKPKGARVTAIAVPTTPGIDPELDPEKAAFFPWIDDRLGRADYALPLFTDQKEDDDDLHMPQWDDDIRLKPKFRDHFNRENIRDTFGLIFMLCGLLLVFVILPVISYTGTSIIDYSFETPMDQMPDPDASQPWAYVNDVKYPLFENIKMDLIDPDTPDDAKTIKSVDGDKMVLVFSDEFNKQNRTFYPGDDPFWFGLDGWYGATVDMEWYDPDALNTGDGTLRLQLDEFTNHNLNYRSGMMNSWNQLCFKGGHFEISMSLPGPAGVHGLWPGAWTMGNLGRPGYLATTDGMWPYTYDDCDTGITPNQSMTDGLSNLPGQRLPSCSCANEDHPTPGTGRGAPEIDIAEVSGDWGGMGVGVATQSYQVAPFDIWWYPNYEYMQLPNYSLSFVNTYTGGPYQQAVSTTSMLNNDWYDDEVYQKYAFEYTPGTDEDAGITWLIGGEEMMSFDGRAIGPNGNVGSRLVSEEPMSMVINLGFSHNWVNIDWDNLKFPTVMYVDYVRWYQKEGEEMVTCDPPGYETTDYIASHPRAYNNPNYTHWEEAGYDWPKNTFMHSCEA